MPASNDDASTVTHRAAAFRTTHWSVVLAAGQQSNPAAAAALATLCGTYWLPLYCYARKRGHDPETARDLTQEFFAQLLEKNWVADADQEKGRFRTFLLTAMQRFLGKEWEKGRTIKRGGRQAFVSLDTQDAEGRYLYEPGHAVTPEKLFERRWALALLEKVLADLKQEYLQAGKSDEFYTLYAFLSGDREAASTAEAARRLDRSEGAVRVAVHRLRQRYGQLLRAGIAQTVARPEDAADELRQLFAVLSE